MAVATFDTLKFANTLKEAGVPPQQAEAQARAFAEVIQLNFKDLATKDDLAAAVRELKLEMAAAEQRQAARSDKMETAHKGEMLLLKSLLGIAVTGIITIVMRLFLFRSPV